jgi:hypothetical protein
VTWQGSIQELGIVVAHLALELGHVRPPGLRQDGRPPSFRPGPVEPLARLLKSTGPKFGPGIPVPLAKECD